MLRVLPSPMPNVILSGLSAMVRLSGGWRVAGGQKDCTAGCRMVSIELSLHRPPVLADLHLGPVGPSLLARRLLIVAGLAQVLEGGCRFDLVLAPPHLPGL